MRVEPFPLRHTVLEGNYSTYIRILIRAASWRCFLLCRRREQRRAGPACLMASTRASKNTHHCRFSCKIKTNNIAA